MKELKEFEYPKFKNFKEPYIRICNGIKSEEIEKRIKMVDKNESLELIVLKEVIISNLEEMLKNKSVKKFKSILSKLLNKNSFVEGKYRYWKIGEQMEEKTFIILDIPERKFYITNYNVGEKHAYLIKRMAIINKKIEKTASTPFLNKNKKTKKENDKKWKNYLKKC
jgi:hypothetical protein